jgi:hypothetical protein
MWTAEQDEILRQKYKIMPGKELVPLIGKCLGAIRTRALHLGLRKKQLPWTPDELETLADELGRTPMDRLVKKLGRSRNAIKIAAYRKLNGLSQHKNIFTAWGVAETLGISCSKTIVAWHDRGYLAGKRAPFSYGNNQVWLFKYEDILKCLQERPWLVDPKRMPESYFRSAVRVEWEKDPWYNRHQAAQFLGLAAPDAVYRYIRAGWLPANRRPMGGGLGEWIIRHSALAAFQLHDPRPAHRKSATVAESLDRHVAEAEQKAWASLSRYKFQMFGYWAGIWVHLNSINRRQKNPFGELVQIAHDKIKTKGETTDESRTNPSEVGRGSGTERLLRTGAEE